MHLDMRACFLALHDVANGRDRALTLHPDFENALAGWTVGSRMSPIWRLRSDPKVIAGTDGFDSCRVTFVGPVQPARISAEVEGLDSALSCWATLGCFNFILQTARNEAGDALAARLTSWAAAKNIAFEQWTLEHGVITDVEQHVLPAKVSNVLTELAKYGDEHRHPAVRSSYQENLVATATGLARAAAVYPPIYDEIERAAKSIGDIMAKFAKHKLNLLEMQSRLLTMNAALSRFSSQAFSGIPPIRGTECHFWIHSLLGTGSANLALASVVASVKLVLGDALIPERLRMLATVTKAVPTAAELTSDDRLLEFDLLDAVEPEAGAVAEIVPLITYFSGRDGFSSHVQTLSAPLTTLAECNSLRSNLLTVTHEISHIFVQSALAELSPTPGNKEDFERATALLEPRAQAATMLDAARQLFLEAIVSIAIEDRDGKTYGKKELPRELPGIVERTRAEVQEILVHAFDFLYFHASDPDYYVSNIWHSWCSIPGIGDRVPEYLMRTLCAVSANLLRQKPSTRFSAALRETKLILGSIEPDIGLPDNYVSKVLLYIAALEGDRGMMQRVEKQYFVRMRLVRLVSVFLFSDKLSSKLFHDPHVGGGEGYKRKRPLQYDSYPIGNVLNFLRGNLKTNPSEAESAWVLHALAFDTSPSPLALQ